MDIRRALVAITSVAALVIVPTGPARASATGDVTFSCTGSFPAWPNQSGSATCNGSAQVSLSGLDTTGSPYSVDAGGSFFANITYSATCGPWTEPTYISTASGTFTVAGVPAIHDGAVTTASLSVPFAWTTILGPGPMATGRATITFADGGTARSEQVGAGWVSVPVVPDASHQCAQGGPVSTLVTGSVTYAL